MRVLNESFVMGLGGRGGRGGSTSRQERALGFMSKLKYVTDPELIGKYVEAEERRKEWFESQGWDFTPNVDPKRLPLMSYDSVADIYGVHNGQTAAAARNSRTSMMRSSPS